MRQIILDTETTGFRPGGIVSLAALEMVDGLLTGAFAHYHLNPGQPCDKGATAVHGLTDEYLATCPKFSEIIVDLDSFFDSSPIIAHNARFDMLFLDTEYQRESKNGYVWRVSSPVRCTLAKAEAQRGVAKGRNSLDALTKAYGTLNIRDLSGGKHGALVDCIQLYGVYRALHGEPQVPLVDSVLQHYLTKGFGVHGPIQLTDPGSTLVPASTQTNPAGIPADIRSIG